jgi:epoxyqueuosine reductase
VSDVSPSDTIQRDLKSELRERASAEGFDAVAFTTPDAIPHAAEGLAAFLAAERHGDMGWLEANQDRRGDPRVLWPEAASVVVFGLNYGPESDPLEALAKTSNGVVSVYARGGDYHDIIKAKLKRLGRWLAGETGAGIKVFVDTAPVMEKPLAQASGLGWQGKHTNLVSREFGSWLFLGSLFTELKFPPDEAEADHCGECTRCLEICPTDAFPRAYELDARRCISYLTIEHKGHIGREFRQAMGNRIFGCDDCLAICPWNKFASEAREIKLAARAETANPPLGPLLGLDDAAFRARFAGTPIKRTGRDRLLRNVLIAAGNSRDTALLPKIETLRADGSALVRAMAVWASAQLMTANAFERARAAEAADESDKDVQAEWREGAS